MSDVITSVSLAKDFGVPLLSVILGAFVGYLPAARLAKRASVETLARDREQRVEAELTEARRAFVKLTLLANAIGSLHQQVEEMVARADRDGNGHMRVSERLSAFAGIDDEPAVLFDASELAPIISAKRADLVDDLLLLQRRYQALIQALREFARRKIELHDLFARHGTTTRAETLVSTTQARVAPDLLNLFRMKAEELDLFAVAMRAQISDHATFAIEVAKLFDAVSAAHFGKGKLPSLAPIDPSVPIEIAPSGPEPAST